MSIVLCNVGQGNRDVDVLAVITLLRLNVRVFSRNYSKLEMPKKYDNN